MDETKEKTEKKGKVKKYLVPVLTLLFTVGIGIGFVYLLKDPETVERFKSYGYLGAFLISLVGNATVLFPVAVLPVLCAISAVLYPVTGPLGAVLVGLAGGAGAGIGEIVGYALGASGRGIVENNKWYLRMVAWMKKWGMLAVFIAGMVPFFFDIAGMAAGALRMPLWKFVLASWLGRTVNYVTFCLMVAVWGHEWLLDVFG